eukprot:6098949-Pyramimonas_sp.AAC.1
MSLSGSPAEQKKRTCPGTRGPRACDTRTSSIPTLPNGDETELAISTLLRWPNWRPARNDSSGSTVRGSCIKYTANPQA